MANRNEMIKETSKLLREAGVAEDLVGEMARLAVANNRRGGKNGGPGGQGGKYWTILDKWTSCPN